jgi:uncharacterized OB-fold protein
VTSSTDWLLGPELAPDTSDPQMAPFYAATAGGVLALPECGACGLALELEQRICDQCGAADIRWAEVEPVGTVHASTLVHRRQADLIHADGPYPIVDVQLASGHRLVMTTVHRSEQQPRVGAPVRVAFRSVGGVAIPAAQLPEEVSPELEANS